VINSFYTACRQPGLMFIATHAHMFRHINDAHPSISLRGNVEYLMTSLRHKRRHNLSAAFSMYRREMLLSVIHLIKKLEQYHYYYPLLEPLCGGISSECRVFTANGLLMSADGVHLTKEGAIESALRMSNTLIDIRNSRLR
jgi:hypothetical protein